MAEARKEDGALPTAPAEHRQHTGPSGFVELHCPGDTCSRILKAATGSQLLHQQAELQQAEADGSWSQARVGGLALFPQGQ